MENKMWELDTTDSGKKIDAQHSSDVRNIKEIFMGRNNAISTIQQFIKFGFVGLMNTGISYGLYFLCVYNGMNVYLGNAIGFAGGVINAYLWNTLWVFKGSRENPQKTLMKFFTTYFFSSFLLSMFLLFLLVELGNVNKYAAPVIIICVTTVVNFSVNKFWTFKK